MGIRPGKYYITTQGTGAGVGRALAEDKSFNPKRVITMDSTMPEAWTVKNVDGNQYTLEVRGAPTATIDNLVFAILTDDPPPTQWFIFDAPEFGPGAYKIVLANNPRQGWFASDEDMNQIKVRPVGGDIGQVFAFAPAED